MIGQVDESQRALLDVLIAAHKGDVKESLRVWIDTAFNGCLVIPRSQIERLGLKQASTTLAVLADGHVVDLETYTCYLDWFGREYRTQIVANEGEFPLLGTMLLDERTLIVDYRQKSVRLT